MDTQGIHEAAAAGDVARIQQLLATNLALMNAPDSQGHTPLHAAVLANQKAVVDALLSRGADVKLKDASGHTPLHLAAAKGYRTSPYRTRGRRQCTRRGRHDPIARGRFRRTQGHG